MFNYIIKAISRAIGFTQTETKGSLVLIFIIIVVIFSFRLRVNHLRNQPPITPDSTDLAWVKEVQASYELKKKEYLKKKTSEETKKRASFDLKKSKRYEPVDTLSKKPLIIKDINLATAEELQEIRGIGPAFSERIIKYRNLLGGFADTTQLHEVYGLKPETISKLTKRFLVSSPVKRLELNTDSIKHLALHPYISYDLARILVNYRKQHGDFKEAKDLRKIKAIDDRTFMRLKPYLE